jgi:nicotinamide phosphoribosyltransferase
MCAGGKEDEVETFRRLLETYPTGILSVVSDTWDLWKVCTEHVVTLKEEILARDGKLVIRPDSGDPVDILCGSESTMYTGDPEGKGVIELLWDVFGGTVNEQGYKVLDSHIGAIYGDSITIDRANEICARLAAKGFASTNVVLGIGSFTYQYNTRDTFGFAMKATYVEVNGEARQIFKNPITDDGTKKSATGLLWVDQNTDGKYVLFDKVTWEGESRGFLQTIYKDGQLYNQTTLNEVREKLKA